MSDMTPDTTELRALADWYPSLSVDRATVRALCDGYDEAQRMRAQDEDADAWVAEYKAERDAARDELERIRLDRDEWRSAAAGRERIEAERDAARDEAQRLRSAWATERDGAEGLAADLHAARQALADLIGELEALCEPYRDDQPVFVRDEDLLAVIDRHAPEGEQD